MTDTRVRLEDLPDPLTTEEAAAYLRVEEDYVRRQCSNGRIKATNLRGKAGYRIPHSSIEAFLGLGKVPAARPRPPRGRKRAR